MARVIEKNVAMAFKCGRNFCGGNTVVTVGENGKTSVYLHGNKIVVWDDSVLMWSDCGWATPTSASRINACLGVINRLHGTAYHYNRRGGYGKVLDGNGNEMPHEITLY